MDASFIRFGSKLVLLTRSDIALFGQVHLAVMNYIPQKYRSSNKLAILINTNMPLESSYISNYLYELINSFLRRMLP